MARRIGFITFPNVYSRFKYNGRSRDVYSALRLTFPNHYRFFNTVYPGLQLLIIPSGPHQYTGQSRRFSTLLVVDEPMFQCDLGLLNWESLPREPVSPSSRFEEEVMRIQSELSYFISLYVAWCVLAVKKKKKTKMMETRNTDRQNIFHANSNRISE